MFKSRLAVVLAALAVFASGDLSFGFRLGTAKNGMNSQPNMDEELAETMKFSDNVKLDGLILNELLDIYNTQLLSKDYWPIKFRLYTRSHNGPFILTPDNIASSPYVKGWPAKLYIPQENYVNSYEREFFEAYKKEANGVNFIVVDVKQSVASFPDEVGLNETVSLIEAIRQYDDKSYIHIIGHSIGAHFASAVAKNVQAKNGQPKINRITGLNPLGAGFSFGDRENWSLSRDSAKFVDVLFTNYGQNAMSRPIGQAIVYFNGGLYQPDCTSRGNDGRFETNTVCNNRMSLIYYIMSIRRSNEPMLSATKCNWYLDYVMKYCDKEEVINAGEYKPDSANGTYFVDIPSIIRQNRYEDNSVHKAQAEQLKSLQQEFESFY